MDENTFDRHIKDKVERFQDSEIDEGALAGLHARMEGCQPPPWYTPYKKVAVYAGVVMLISLLNYGLFSYIQNNNIDKEKEVTLKTLAENQEAYFQLRTDFEALKNSKSKTDTVYILKTIYTGDNAQVSNAQSSASENITAPPQKDRSTSGSGKLASIEEEKKPASEPDITQDESQEIILFMLREQFAYINEDGKIHLKLDSNTNKKGKQLLKGTAYQELRLAKLPSDKVVEVPAPNLQEIKTDKNIQLSARTINAIEKHKMNGIGFQYGPELDLFKLNTDANVGNPGIAAGLMSEFIMSPSWRIETGVKYAYTGYKIDQPEDLGESLASFPNISNQLGELSQIEQKSHVLSFPVHLKYHYPIAQDKSLFAAVGMSPQLYLKQDFEYEYLLLVDTDDGVFVSEIESPNRIKDRKLYAGTYDFSLGFEKKLKSKSILQFSAFYNQSAGNLGIEHRSLNMIGLRSSVRFRVK